MTVRDATATIRASRIPEEVHHLPVVDQAGCLTGIVGLRALLLNSDDRHIADLMERDIKAVRADLDREAVAMEFDRYDYFMMPVIDRAERLLGIVTVDDVIDIIRREQTEDVQKTVGAGGQEAVYSRLTEKFRGRFPWLAISLILTCVAAIVVIFAEEMIRQQPILAFLMPVIAALVGNAGHQALAVTLRGLVLDEVRRERVAPLVLREAMVGLIQGCLLGVLMFLFVCFLGLFTAGATWQVGLVAALALAVAMGVGTLAGSGIPLLMRSLGRDPAQSSAILLIFITDLLAFSTLLGLTHLSAAWLLSPPGAI
jgi:magnesium transporter